MAIVQRFEEPRRQQYMQCGQESMRKAAQRLLKKGVLLVAFKKRSVVPTPITKSRVRTVFYMMK